MRRGLLRATALLGALAIAGCAATAPAELPSVPVPVPVAVAPAPAPAPRTTIAPGSPGDTVPSPAARAVLASIPEPIAGGAAANPPAPQPAPVRTHPDVAPPPVTAAAVPPPAAPAAPDTTIAASDTSTSGGDTLAVPVPAHTTPLGAGTPAVLPPTPPSVSPPAVPPPVVAPPAAPAMAPPATSAAVSDTCWRLQVGAPAEQARGRQLLAASQSQLLVPMVVSREAGRWKVRSRDCMSRAAAESLRDRAVASGFKGVFLVRYVEHRR